MEKQREYSTVTIHTFVMGSLGSWDPDNADCLRDLKIGANYSKLFKKLCAIDSIKGSHAIWKAR